MDTRQALDDAVLDQAFRRRLFGRAYATLRNVDDANDAVQTAIENAYAQIAIRDLETPERVHGFLWTILKRAIARHIEYRVLVREKSEDIADEVLERYTKSPEPSQLENLLEQERIRIATEATAEVKRNLSKYAVAESTREIYRLVLSGKRSSEIVALGYTYCQERCARWRLKRQLTLRVEKLTGVRESKLSPRKWYSRIGERQAILARKHAREMKMLEEFLRCEQS